MKTLFLISVLALGVYVAPVRAGIVNGDFENGLTGWTTNTCTGACFAQGWNVQVAPNLSPTHAAATACVFAVCLSPVTGDWLGQTPTGVVTGQSYVFSIGINPVQAGCAACEIDIYWAGTLQAQYSNLAAGYSIHTLNLVGGDGNGSNFLQITGRHDPATIYIDDVGFGSGASTNTPEPVTSLLLGCGLAVCGFYRRKQALSQQ